MESKKNSFISKAIKFFTGKLAKKYNVKSYTHSMYIIGDVLKVESVLSAELAISVMPLDAFRTKDYSFDVYKVNDHLTMSEIDEILREIYVKTAGKDYGFLQLLWFVYRWLMELFGFDVRKQKNWFPNGDVCSENTYRYLYNRLKRNFCDSRTLTDYLIKQTTKQMEEWNENTFHPIDLAYVMKKEHSLFEHVESWDGEKK